MANTAALLSVLLNTNADINYYTQQQIFWSSRYEANAAKLQVQTSAETKWYEAFDSALDNTKELRFGSIVVGENNKNEDLADAYAHAKVSKYSEELSIELAALDVEYDTMKTMYETILEQLRAEKDGEKTATQTAAQDTGLLQ